MTLINKIFILIVISTGLQLHAKEFDFESQKEGIIVIGEQHYLRDTDKLYPKILNDLKKRMSSPFCLLQEYPSFVSHTGVVVSDFYQILNLYFNTSKEHSQSRELFRILYNYLPESGEMQDQFLVNAIKDKVPTYFIDLPNIEQDSLGGNLLELMNTRDIYMAQNIQKIWEQGLCKSAILITGVRHISSTDTGRFTLKQHLKKMPIKSQFVKVHDPLQPPPVKLITDEGPWTDYDSILTIP